MRVAASSPSHPCGAPRPPEAGCYCDLTSRTRPKHTAGVRSHTCPLDTLYGAERALSIPQSEESKSWSGSRRSVWGASLARRQGSQGARKDLCGSVYVSWSPSSKSILHFVPSHCVSLPGHHSPSSCSTCTLPPTRGMPSSPHHDTCGCPPPACPCARPPCAPRCGRRAPLPGTPAITRSRPFTFEL